MIHASAPGRCGLVGNPTDMYGGSVLSCSTRERARCTLSRDTEEFVITVSGQSQTLHAADDLALRPGDYLNVVRAALVALEVDPVNAPPFHLVAETDIPMQAGLAGSTAILACIVGCLLAHLGLRLNPYQTAELVRQIEYDVLGIVCGFQDHYMTVFGGLNFMDFRDKNSAHTTDGRTPFATIEPLAPFVGDLPFVLAHTGVRHHSGSVHTSPRERWLRGEPAVVDGYLEVARLARWGKRALLSSDWDTLANLMNRNHVVVRDLGGSGEANEAMIQAALASGATGAKLAGAGGGGTILALTHDREKTVNALRAAGAEAILFPGPQAGLTVEMAAIPALEVSVYCEVSASGTEEQHFGSISPVAERLSHLVARHFQCRDLYTVLMDYPKLSHRSRRLRGTPGLRGMVRETTLSVGDLIDPLFVTWGAGRDRRPISSLPGVAQLTVEALRVEAEQIAALGLPAVLLFGLPESKDDRATGAYADDGIVQRAVRALKADNPALLVFTDVCLCEYMSHGHCGVVSGERILNDPSLDLLARTAVSHAAAGADVVAPSDMMDGRVAAVRHALDAQGFSDTPLLSYAAKYASAMYGPFREAADSAPQFGDRRTYQMDPANRREALKEVEQDIAEGADMIMVKPALAFLDIIRDVREMTHLPVAAYNVSGEYAMVKAASANGWLDERATALEILTSIKRAGADLIFTYHAKDAARWLKQ